MPARFLILHIASRPDDSGAQSERLGAALRAAGTPAEVVSVEGATRRSSASSARPAIVATERADAFARAVRA